MGTFGEFPNYLHYLETLVNGLSILPGLSSNICSLGIKTSGCRGKESCDFTTFISGCQANAHIFHCSSCSVYCIRCIICCINENIYHFFGPRMKLCIPSQNKSWSNAAIQYHENKLDYFNISSK